MANEVRDEIVAVLLRMFEFRHASVNPVHSPFLLTGHRFAERLVKQLVADRIERRRHERRRLRTQGRIALGQILRDRGESLCIVARVTRLAVATREELPASFKRALRRVLPRERLDVDSHRFPVSPWKNRPPGRVRRPVREARLFPVGNGLFERRDAGQIGLADLLRIRNLVAGGAASGLYDLLRGLRRGSGFRQLDLRLAFPQ